MQAQIVQHENKTYLALWPTTDEATCFVTGMNSNGNAVYLGGGGAAWKRSPFEVYPAQIVRETATRSVAMSVAIRIDDAEVREALEKWLSTPTSRQRGVELKEATEAEIMEELGLRAAARLSTGRLVEMLGDRVK